MNYQFMRPGEKYPAIGVLQKLLNTNGASLVVDGDFGGNTKAAVKAFQAANGLGADGIVGEKTWPKLATGIAQLKIVDLIDVFDDTMWTGAEQWEAQDIRGVGGKPIQIGGMSNGVEVAVGEIVRAASPRSVWLLRIHGHGAPGGAGISTGTGAAGEHFSAIHTGNVDQLTPVLSRLTSIFGPYGCIQLMHCSTGRGAKGKLLLTKIANAVGVPCTAAVYDQYGGGGTNTFAFEGPTQTAIPTGVSLKDWCKALPDFVGMSVK